jgi:hypothetical protein
MTAAAILKLAYVLLAVGVLVVIAGLVAIAGWPSIPMNPRTWTNGSRESPNRRGKL